MLESSLRMNAAERSTDGINAGGISSIGPSSARLNAGGGSRRSASGAGGATGVSATRGRHAPVKVAERSDVEPLGSLDFRAIYERWFDEVSRWVRALGGPEADREDLVQDVFAVVHRRLPDFDGDNLPGWLYQITRHRVRDFRRLVWVKRILFGSVPLPENLAKEGASPIEILETRQKRAMLERLLDRLTESERLALVLFEIDGYSGEEIAEILGVPLNTVWSRTHKARRKLLGWLAKDESSARTSA
ncbi:MAG TPA: sigma-70 family RNA polymerase sigma factor [Polyangiaceae bacterium]|nr:sigma-70 family RNA polymerase sigma factor [Polyangiaceae bacterium]